MQMNVIMIRGAEIAEGVVLDQGLDPLGHRELWCPDASITIVSHRVAAFDRGEEVSASAIFTNCKVERVSITRS
jgi:hypothetical protein